jgi:nitrous oxidase accessory protein NosD
VDLTTDGDTVKVCPGTYTETVTVDESITLVGAKAGIDARTRGTANETVMDDPDGAFDVEADDVVIDGFTITIGPATGGGGLDAGVFTSPDFAGYEIRNNIFRENMAGIYLNSNGNLRTVVRRNLFEDNDAPGAPWSGSGIYSDLSLFDALIEENRFEGHAQTSVFLGGGRNGSSTSQADVVIADNVMFRDNSIALYNTIFSSIIGNTFDGNVFGTSTCPSAPQTQSAVFVGGGVRALDILANDFLSGCRGINMPVTGSEPETSSDIVAHYNRFVSSRSWAVFITDGRYDGILDARWNWWGSSTGPREWGNGFGDAIWAGVQFFPWSTNRRFDGFARCSNRFTARADVVRGTSGSDILCGGGGKDTLRGGAGNDLLLGGSGADILRGQVGDDRAIGEAGNDLVDGGADTDSVQGWDGVDVCTGERWHVPSCEQT